MSALHSLSLASIPSPELEHARARAVLDPLLRADAPRRDRRGGRHHRDPLDAARRRLGPHLPARGLGRRLRDHRRAPLPRRHELGRASRTSGGGRSRSGRAASASGAGSASASSSARSSRSGRARASSALADCVAPGLLVAQGIGRFGNWWNQELFGEPDRSAVGPRDLRRQPADRATSRARPSTRPSSTRRSGASPPRACC